MVLHHLDTDHSNFPNYRKALKTLIKFLKPGGKVCINSFYREQLNGIWFGNIHPISRERHFKRYAPREVVKEAFECAGFENYKEIKCHELFYGLKYYDCSMPLDEQNRKTSSFYVDVQDHLDEYLDRLKGMITDGSIVQYIYEQEKIKQEHGQTIFIVGQKPGGHC